MLSIILVFLLLAIAYQDLRHHSVQWILIALAGAVNVVAGVRALSPSEVLTYTIMNLVFIAINIGVLAVYLAVRFKASLRNMFSQYIGIGDVLFWMALTPLFSVFNFIYFHLLSLLVSLILFLLLRLFFTSLKKSAIPLAGLQALFYIQVFIAVWCGWDYDFYYDLGFIDLTGIGNY
jgi:hypothetical protein